MPSPQPLIRRRSLALGTAWAAPALVTAAAAPAFASSVCIPTVGRSGGMTYDWGNIASDTTNQFMTIGGQTYVSGLPAGVTVTKVTYQWWIENRVGQASPGPGIYWVGNRTSSLSSSCSTSGCTLKFATATPGSGWSTTVTNTKNLVNVAYPDGVVRPSWDLNFTWSASADPSSADNYKADGACTTFTTGPSGRLRIDYTGVVAKGTVAQLNAHDLWNITVTLSDGTVLGPTATMGTTAPRA